MSDNGRHDPTEWARRLGVSKEAIDLYLASDVIDLHVDTFIWTRVFGYDLGQRHGTGLFGGRYYGHADLPRIREAAITGAIWSITTNPFRPAASRPRVFGENLRHLREIFARHPQDVALVRNAAEYRAARAAGRHAAFVGIQGGNALDGDGTALDAADDLVIKVTVVHLTRSELGATSAPSPWPSAAPPSLTAAGHTLVEQLNARRVFVDLAHIHRVAFFEAMAAHDRSQPLLVSHAGVTGVHPHWRNIDDEQLRVVADTGGVVGVIYHRPFLGPGARRASAIVDHLAHVVDTVGEDVPALGSDWDGAIIPPEDMPTCLELPRLVQLMLDRRWSADRVRKILGGNYLRAVAALRG
jgi:membrane dipeptidase